MITPVSRYVLIKTIVARLHSQTLYTSEVVPQNQISGSNRCDGARRAASARTGRRSDCTRFADSGYYHTEKPRPNSCESILPRYVVTIISRHFTLCIFVQKLLVSVSKKNNSNKNSVQQTGWNGTENLLISLSRCTLVRRV